MAQCSSCQFHNLPGSTHCGRCGASLGLATAAIDVHPPRATAWAKFWRKSFVARTWRASNHAWRSAAQRMNLEPGAGLPEIGVLWRLILPGWPQLHSGRRLLGQGLLAAFAVSVLLAVVLCGTTLGSLMVGVAIMVHSASIYDVAFHSTQVRGGRISRFLLGCAVIVLCVYYPAIYLIGQVAAPITILVDRPPLRNGDVLLVNAYTFQFRQPRVGDVVAYDVPALRYAGRGFVNTIYVVQGERIDRIVAGPRESVEWANGVLTVDGHATSRQPLNPGKPATTFRLTVPPRHYLILPSTDWFGPAAMAEITPEQWAAMSLVPAESIRGQVYWQNWPIWRMGPVR